MVYHKRGISHAVTSNCKGWVSYLIVVLIIILNSQVAKAQGNYDDALCNVLNCNALSLGQAAELKSSKSTLASGVFLEHYIDFLNLIAYSKPIDEQTFALVAQSRIEQIEKLNKTYQYSGFLSEMALHLAFTHALKGDYLKSARMVWQAHQYFEDIPKANGFSRVEYVKLQAIFDVLIGAIPDDQRWIANMLSLKGDAPRGMQQLAKLCEDSSLQKGARLEILLVEKLLRLYFEDSAVVKVDDAAIYSSPLGLYLDGALFLKRRCCFDCGLIDNAAVDKFPLLGYLKGRMLLNALNDSCLHYFDVFEDAYSGESFKADVLLRRAWYARIGNNPSTIALSKQRLLSIKSFPTAIDRQARFEIENVEKYPKELLKARLLFDGGDYDEAQVELSGYKADDAYLCEYYYRQGRICHEQGRETEALDYYQKCIYHNTNPQRYFAANAALQMAHILYVAGRFDEANRKLDTCELLNIGDYKGDIKNNAAKLRHQISVKKNQ